MLPLCPEKKYTMRAVRHGVEPKALAGLARVVRGEQRHGLIQCSALLGTDAPCLPVTLPRVPQKSPRAGQQGKPELIIGHS